MPFFDFLEDKAAFLASLVNVFDFGLTCLISPVSDGERLLTRFLEEMEKPGKAYVRFGVGNFANGVERALQTRLILSTFKFLEKPDPKEGITPF